MAIRTGTLVNDVRSPYSSPYVHYSATYSAERDDSSPSAVSVTLRFKAWLQHAASFLGNGIVLTVHARISGGSWKSVTIKSRNDEWHGNTTKYSADDLTVTGTVPSGKATVEFYVTRDDRGGNSGRIASANKPKKYTASLPVYSTQTENPPAHDDGGRVFVKVSGVWKRADGFINSGGVWKRARVFIKSGGTWNSI